MCNMKKIHREDLEVLQKEYSWSPNYIGADINQKVKSEFKTDLLTPHLQLCWDLNID